MSKSILQTKDEKYYIIGGISLVIVLIGSSLIYNQYQISDQIQQDQLTKLTEQTNNYRTILANMIYEQTHYKGTDVISQGMMCYGNDCSIEGTYKMPDGKIFSTGYGFSHKVTTKEALQDEIIDSYVNHEGEDITFLDNICALKMWCGDLSK